MRCFRVDRAACVSYDIIATDVASYSVAGIRGVLLLSVGLSVGLCLTLVDPESFAEGGEVVGVAGVSFDGGLVDWFADLIARGGADGS